MRGAITTAAVITALLVVTGLATEGEVYVGKITDNRHTQWVTTGQWAVVHGDNSKLRIQWMPDERAYYITIEGSQLTADTDGRIPPMRLRWGGASNQVWVETRWVN
jgi:hypothetical protein